MISKETLREQEKINRKYYQIYHFIKTSFADGEIIDKENIVRRYRQKFPGTRCTYQLRDLVEQAIETLEKEGWLKRSIYLTNDPFPPQSYQINLEKRNNTKEYKTNKNKEEITK